MTASRSHNPHHYPNTGPSIKTGERLHLEPGDVLILTSPKPLTDYTIAKLTLQMRDNFGPDVPIAILDAGLRLQVINKAEFE